MADNMGASLNQLESTLDDYLGKRAPALPTGVKDFIVKIAPWLTLVLVIIALPAVLVVFGLGALVAPFSFLGGAGSAANYGFTVLLSTVVLAVSLVLEAMAIPGLFARSKKGWRMLYWATLVSLVSSLISFNVIGGIVSALISLYFLFQVKSYYK